MHHVLCVFKLMPPLKLFSLNSNNTVIQEYIVHVEIQSSHMVLVLKNF